MNDVFLISQNEGCTIIIILIIFLYEDEAIEYQLIKEK
jgi:hypothetical protein